MKPTLHHKKWRIRWFDSKNIRRSLSFKTYIEAEKWITIIEKDQEKRSPIQILETENNLLRLEIEKLKSELLKLK